MSSTVASRLHYERGFTSQGLHHIAGVDEAGRGSLAGPVSAGAVILPLRKLQRLEKLIDVRDSKRCTPRQRDSLYELIVEHALTYACGLASSSEIDEMGISSATKLAMKRAVEALTPQPEALVIDWVRLKAVNLPQKSIKQGEDHSISIAAASIIAKVERDRLMVELDEKYPGYGLARNKGYGTRQHRQAIVDLGPSPVHRMTFAPARTGLFDDVKVVR